MKRGKVVLAEAHQSMLAGVRTILERIFARVFMVVDEASLVEAIERIRPDLVVADLSFPVSRHGNIVGLLKALFPELRLIVLSIHDEPVAVKCCMENGVSGFVLKRQAVNDLLPAIEAVLNGRRYISPGIIEGSAEPIT